MDPDDDASIPLDEARERYRIEREKRLRTDGNAQYKEFTGDLAEFDRDPYVEPGFTRDAIAEDIGAVIVGAGFAGMLCAINLTRHGIRDFRMVEKAGDFGGTWYWNRYPG
ncbi:MAG: NAD(P)-binding protein, partial [Acidimicrobiia bacterium]|nr:NAD(P)-binding protein [Acidimicrobiia bacterium]